MRTSKNGLILIEQFEGLRLKAYLCSAGVATIGIGSTRYEDGSKVKMGDIITKDRAYGLFSNTLISYENCINKLVKTNITQNQFDSLVSLCYNIGCGNISKSSVIKLINIDPNDINIESKWVLWNKGGGKVLTGLTTRRLKEIRNYYV